MSTLRVQSLRSLRDEMIAVSRGERPAPVHAAEPSVHSADLITGLLTPSNRALLSVIREHRPESIAALAALTHRAPSNLTRTLDKLAAIGIVRFTGSGKRKMPHAMVGTIRIEIDPFSEQDKITLVTKRNQREEVATHGSAGGSKTKVKRYALAVGKTGRKGGAKTAAKTSAGAKARSVGTSAAPVRRRSGARAALHR